MLKFLNSRFSYICLMLIMVLAFIAYANYGPSANASHAVNSSPVYSSVSAQPSDQIPLEFQATTYLPLIPSETTILPIVRTQIPPDRERTLRGDIMVVDQKTHRLYFTDNTAGGVDVFNVSGKQAVYLQTIPTDPTLAHGLALDTDVNELFVSLDDSSVVVIDINPKNKATYYTIIKKISTGGTKTADEMDYDSVHKRLWVADADDGIVVVIDVNPLNTGTFNTVIKTFTGLGAGLEQPRFNPNDNMVYLCASAQNALIQFDAVDLTLDHPKNTFVSADLNSPCGLAINPKTNKALIGCGNPVDQYLSIWDFVTQSVVKKTTHAGWADVTLYDPVVNLYFAACAGYSHGPVVAILNGTTGDFITDVPTAPVAHMLAYDRYNKMVYTSDWAIYNASLVAFRYPK